MQVLPILITVLLAYLAYIFFFRTHQQTGQPRPQQQPNAAPKALSSAEFILGKHYKSSRVCVDLAALCSTPPFTLTEAGGAFLRELLDLKCEVFVYCQIAETDKERVLSALRPFGQLGLVRDRVLFCTTVKAHEAFTRQLIPTLLVSTHLETVSAVARHIPYVLMVSETKQFEASNVTCTSTIDTLN